MGLAKFNPCQPCCFTSNCCVSPKKVPGNELCFKMYQPTYSDNTTIYQEFVGSTTLNKTGTHTWTGNIKVLTSQHQVYKDINISLTCNTIVNEAISYKLTLITNGVLTTVYNVPNNSFQCSPHFLINFDVIGSDFINGLMQNHKIIIEDLEGDPCLEDGERLGVITGVCTDLIQPAPAIHALNPDGNLTSIYNGATLAGKYQIGGYIQLVYNDNCEYISPRYSLGNFSGGIISFNASVTRFYQDSTYFYVEQQTTAYNNTPTILDSWTVTFKLLKTSWNPYTVNNFYFDNSTSIFTLKDYLGNTLNSSHYLQVHSILTMFSYPASGQVNNGTSLANIKIWPQKTMKHTLYATIECPDCPILDGLTTPIILTSSGYFAYLGGLSWSGIIDIIAPSISYPLGLSLTINLLGLNSTSIPAYGYPYYVNTYGIIDVQYGYHSSFYTPWNYMGALSGNVGTYEELTNYPFTAKATYTAFPGDVNTCAGPFELIVHVSE